MHTNIHLVVERLAVTMSMTFQCCRAHAERREPRMTIGETDRQLPATAAIALGPIGSTGVAAS